MTRAPAPAPTPAVTANAFPLPAKFKKDLAAFLTLPNAADVGLISSNAVAALIGSASIAAAQVLDIPPVL